MTLKLLAQNALDAFSDPKTAAEYIELVKQQRPDVAVFPEAYDADRLQSVSATMERLASLGYEVLYGSYDDTDGRTDLHGIVLIVRSELAATDRPGRLTQVGTRNIAEVWLTDPASQKTVHVMGMHLNDRSEAKRQAELDDLLDMVVADESTIIVGDLNTLHANDGRRPALWPAHLLALLVKLHMFPARDPVQTLHQKKTLAWLGSRSRRLSEMASGKTVRRLEAAGFTDADTLHRPTFPASRPFVQLDHIMLANGLQVGSFETVPKGASDHLGIVATITL